MKKRWGFVGGAILLGMGLFTGCSDVKTLTPGIGDGDEPKSLECAIRNATTMQGEALELKVSTLWIEVSRDAIFRADEYPRGQVIRNPYFLQEQPLPAAVLATAKEKGISWKTSYVYRHGDFPKWILLDGKEGSLLTVFPKKAIPTVVEEKGELLSFVCQEVEAGSIRPHVELIPADLPRGCADDTVEQDFNTNMVGCSGSVPYRDRGTLCAPGWKPCSAQEWVDRLGSGTPQFNYWTDDDLRYSGSNFRCQVSTASGSLCTPSAEPMRICASTKDPLGNKCNWTRCGLNTTSSNHYFGGCAQGDTAGSICCQ